jgi:hypothetical protein
VISRCRLRRYRDLRSGLEELDVVDLSLNAWTVNTVHNVVCGCAVVEEVRVGVDEGSSRNLDGRVICGELNRTRLG